MNKKMKVILIISLIGNLFIIYVAYKALGYRASVNYFLDKYTNVVSEFSGRHVYEEDDNRLSADRQIDNRIVFLGSQITHGWDLNKYFPGFEAINRGISGQRISGFLLRFKPDVVDLKPAAVLIEFSSYNFRPESSVREIEDYISSLADIARMHAIEPILTSVIPVGKDFKTELEVPYNVLDSLREFNRWLQEYCRDNNLKFVDFYAIVADSEGYFSTKYMGGQILLNEAGYDKISEATLSVLKELKE